METLAPELVPEFSETVAAVDRDDCLRALKASVALYRKVRDGSDVERRVDAERAVVDYLA